MNTQQISEANKTLVQSYRPLPELLPESWEQAKVRLPDGLEMAYTRTGGDKPALVLLHGVQVSGVSWLRVAQAFEADYSVIMPDLRGHGLTGGLDDSFSASTIVADVIAFMEALQLDKPYLVGHSMGADIAGRVAAVRPIECFVLVDPALVNFYASMPPMGDELPPYMQPIADTIANMQQQSHTERMASGLVLLPPGMSPSQWHEIDYVTFVEGQAHFDMAFYKHMPKLGYLFEDSETISKIDCPILLLTAKPMFAKPDTPEQPGIAAFKQSWQQGEHILIEDAGHAIHFDQFERFVNVVGQFFDRVKS